MTITEDSRSVPVSPDTYLSASLPITTASSSPAFPVRRLAPHELAMTPLSPCPLVCRKMFPETVMDAAGNSFLVKTAAPHEGFADATRTRNPTGYVPEVGTNLCLSGGMGGLPNASNLENLLKGI